MAAAGVRGHEIAKEADDFRTRAVMAGNAESARSRVSHDDLQLFNYQTKELDGLTGKLTATLNSGLAQELQKKILLGASAPDSAIAQNQAKAAREELNRLTKPIEDQIAAQRKNIEVAGKRAFGDKWSVTPAAPAAAPAPISQEAFDKQWSTLKSGQTLTGPDGKTYTKK